MTAKFSTNYRYDIPDFWISVFLDTELLELLQKKAEEKGMTKEQIEAMVEYLHTEAEEVFYFEGYEE